MKQQSVNRKQKIWKVKKKILLDSSGVLINAEADIYVVLYVVFCAFLAFFCNFCKISLCAAEIK